MSLLTSRPLNIIMEEDEPSSRSPSPSSIKAKRRHARITRDDLADFDTAFASPSYQSSAASSPDSLKLTFPDLFKFPRPPASDSSSSPGAHSSGMPLTPDSDFEFTLPSPRFNPRRAAIQPRPFNRERVDSDEESDSEWYHKQFSKLIQSPRLSPQLQPSRPDSILFPSDSDNPTTKRRSLTSDTVYPRRRNSKSRSITIPNYPPPVPPIPLHLRTAPCPPPPQRTLVNVSRPPPRSSLPADCVVDPYMDGCDADSDSSSAFSFTMYQVDFGEQQHAAYDTCSVPAFPRSPCSDTMSRHSEFVQEIEVDPHFDLDYQLTLPFSVPATPLDLETDIARSFERFREEETATTAGETPAPVQTTLPSPSASSAYSQDSVYTPVVSPFSFSTSPSASSFEHTDDFPSFNRDGRVLKSKWSSSTLGSIHDEARHKNREGRSASAKWKLFGGSTSPSKTSSSKTSKRPSSSSTKSVTPSTPTSPLIFKSPSSHSRKTKAHSLSPSPLRWPQSRAYKSKRMSTQTQTRHSTHTHQPTYSSDVIVIGYGDNNNSAGLKRRGSNATVSSEGGMSEMSSSSSSSNGLRRKPIPIEMFLRNAA